MQSDLQSLLTQHASAVFGLIGALGGGALSFVAALLLKRREFDLQVAGKLLERRIAAHEKVIALAVEMRVMVSLGGTSIPGEVRRAPQVLLSKEEFDRWFTRFTQLTMEGTTWLENSVKREVNFVQDYLISLHMNLSSVPSDKYLVVGEHVRQDFVDLSSSLEKAAFRFFDRGVTRLRLESLDKWHKYKQTETEARLRSTALVRTHGQIAEAVQREADVR